MDNFEKLLVKNEALLDQNWEGLVEHRDRVAKLATVGFNKADLDFLQSVLLLVTAELYQRAAKRERFLSNND